VSRKALVPIQLPADPANPLEAATKQYVDAQVTANANNEVAISATDPGAAYELWIDTSV
jgi:hypothetical protein